MASKFDPKAFIEAEIAERSQTIASVCEPFPHLSIVAETAEIRQKLAPSTATVATIATIAGPLPKSLPWDPAIVEFSARPCPSTVQDEFWDELTNEVLSVSRHWGKIALNAGWSVLDLFACNPNPLKRRVDRDGLVHSIVQLRTPVRIVELTSAHAALEDRKGSVMRHRRALRAPGAALIWDAYAMPSGP